MQEVSRSHRWELRQTPCELGYQPIFVRTYSCIPHCFPISGLLASSIDWYRCEPGAASLGPDEIDEYALVVVLQVGQVVGEVGEVVADASLQVLADLTIDCRQRASAALTNICEVKRSHLGHAVPLLEEAPVDAEDGELRRVVEEIRVHAIEALLS